MLLLRGQFVLTAIIHLSGIAQEQSVSSQRFLHHGNLLILTESNLVPFLYVYIMFLLIRFFVDLFFHKVFLLFYHSNVTSAPIKTFARSIGVVLLVQRMFKCQTLFRLSL